ncbi:hypothetical protein V2H45_21685 [Tumidithrix elongata RA019]|uniref:Uncharacterized protein n=1 Tax=Tumidithrix elongata BACA0141 TaxID=2716417 RepID=A0AAW9PWI3_9CYAN|nr:hypothetical protein [Tumidithrix elongata RA019]
MNWRSYDGLCRNKLSKSIIPTNQITGVDYSFQTDENYTYDDNGNRTNAGYVTGVNNRLLEDNKFRYEYDLVGNRTKRTDKSTNESIEYTWDLRQIRGK